MGPKAGDRRTLWLRLRCRDRVSEDPGHDALQSLHAGIGCVALSVASSSMPSARGYACRLVVHGRRVRPHSILLWSTCCGSSSVRLPSILVCLAQYLRYDGSRSGSRYRTYNVGLFGATSQSERPNSAGRVSLPNSESKLK